MTPLEWMLQELGTAEIPGDQDNPRIVWYHSHTTLKATDDETPWCSAVLCAAAEACGYPSTRSAAARSWLKYGERGYGDKGEIVVLSRGTNPTQGHVGILAEDFRPGDLIVHVLGGNQGNEVSVQSYDTRRVLAFRRFVRRES